MLNLLKKLFGSGVDLTACTCSKKDERDPWKHETECFLYEIQVEIMTW